MVPYIWRRCWAYTPLEESPTVFLQVVDPSGVTCDGQSDDDFPWQGQAAGTPAGPMRATQTHVGMTSLPVSSEVGRRQKGECILFDWAEQKFQKSQILICGREAFTVLFAHFWKTTDCREQTSRPRIFIWKPSISVLIMLRAVNTRN